MKKRFTAVLPIIIALLLCAIVYSDDFSRSTLSIKDKEAGEQVFFVASKTIATQELWFTSSQPIADASIIIEPSKGIVGLPGVENAYEYETIAKLGLSDSELSDFKIVFRVESEWISNNSDKDLIQLSYYDNGWIAINAIHKSSDGLYDYYEAYPGKITYLAISGKQKKEEIMQEQKNTETTSAATPPPNQDTTSLPKADTNSKKEYFSNKNITIYSMAIGGILITLVLLFYLFKMIINGEYLENIKEAEDFIDEEIMEGISKKEIETELEGKGWPKKVVEKLVRSHHIPPDTEVKIKASIQAMRNNSVNDEEVKKNLAKQGWAEDLIEEMMQEATF